MTVEVLKEKNVNKFSKLDRLFQKCLKIPKSKKDAAKTTQLFLEKLTELYNIRHKKGYVFKIPSAFSEVLNGFKRIF